MATSLAWSLYGQGDIASITVTVINLHRWSPFASMDAIYIVQSLDVHFPHQCHVCMVGMPLPILSSSIQLNLQQQSFLVLKPRYLKLIM